MTTWLVTRHPGAKEWVARRGIKVDQVVDHFDVNLVSSGDKVLGSLPVSLASEITSKKAVYYHLTLVVPEELRGVELSAQKMEELGAELIPYLVKEAVDVEPWK